MGSYGIDVSHHQGTIDWPSVAVAKVRWAAIKVTEGTTFVDPQGFRNVSEAHKAGIATCGYHFAAPHKDMSLDRAVAEAAFYTGHKPVGPAILDWESTPEQNFDHTISRVSQVDWINQWASCFHLPVIVYCDLHDALALSKAADDLEVALPRLWLARWVGRRGTGVRAIQPSDGDRYVKMLKRSAWRDLVWWQWNSHGRVAGISGEVDMDVALGRL